jgi:hypothetical protein
MALHREYFENVMDLRIRCRVSVMGGDAADWRGQRRSDQRWMGTTQEAVTCGRFKIITGDRKPALLHTGIDQVEEVD